MTQPPDLTGILSEFNTLVDKDEALKKAAQSQAVALVGEDGLDSDVPGYLSTQCPMLNWAIGRPGIPQGRVTTIIGLEASGKSTLAQQILAETQRIGGIATLLDAERRYWRARAEAIGIDGTTLVQLRGETLEQSLTLIEKFILAVRSKDPDVPLTIAYDSVAGSPTQADLDASYGDSIPARHARLLALGMRRIHPLLAKHNVALILVNQLRQSINMTGFQMGRPKMVMLGEHPLTYWSSLKIYLQQTARVGPPDDPTGITVRAEILKNTVAPPFKKCTFNIDFQHGVDTDESALELALQLGLVEGRGGWYKYAEREKTFRRDEFSTVLADYPKLQDMIAAAPLLWTTEGDEPEEES